MLSQEEKKQSYKYCCFIEASSAKACMPYTQEMYDAIGKADTKDLPGNIECYSPFIKLTMLGLLFLAL